ncbi:phage repressor protein [Leuconostoc citreum]|uniref:XRE family transcriptional regulator n=1 Tax=Leuconostoc citreum TaxID=33964 RepID=UPI0021A565DB|nr:XRE family transcriptional regulator [Leuconostoc citreum]MCT3069038.1 phage repressor protein [Leuconostoc citreum]
MNREIYLKELIESKFGSVRYFAEQIGIPYTTVRSILERGVLNAKMENIINICKGLGITPEQLYNFEDSIISKINKFAVQLNEDRQQKVYNFTEQQYNEQNKIIKFPTNKEVMISGAVSAGTGEYLGDGHKEIVSYNGDIPVHDFAVIVNGDSMEPTFADKQIIFVKKTSDVRNGQFVIADYDHQAYVKKFMRDENGCRLVSLNKKYNDMPINDEHELSIFGVVVL